MIYTSWTLAPGGAPIKGEAPEGTIQVTQPGGCAVVMWRDETRGTESPRELCQKVNANSLFKPARFAPGETAVVFVTANHSLVGWSQGKLAVDAATGDVLYRAPKQVPVTLHLRTGIVQTVANTYNEERYTLGELRDRICDELGGCEERSN